MRVKLRAVGEEGKLHYVGWRYHEYFLEQPDEAFFPWALAYFYTDDTDAAIDVAGVLGLAPVEVTAVKEQLLEPLTKRDSVDEWHVLAPIARHPGGDKKPPRMLHPATPSASLVPRFSAATHLRHLGEARAGAHV
jgi:hypothetical protein